MVQLGKALTIPAGWEIYREGWKILPTKDCKVERNFEAKPRALSHFDNFFLSLKVRKKALYSTVKQFLSIYQISFSLPSQENYTSQYEISCHRKTFPATGRNFLQQEDISCYSKKIWAILRYILSQEKVSCHRK